MKNSTNLKENLQDFIEERLNESYTNIAYTKEYKAISNKNANIMEKITDKIKDNKLIEEYKKTEYDMYEMQLQQAYLTGIRDSNIILYNQNLLYEGD